MGNALILLSEEAMDSFEQIDIHKAKELIDSGNVNIVDIRDPDSFNEAHIKGAVLLDDHSVEEFVSKADKTRPLICYCFLGNSSQSAAQYFKNNGFETVYSVMGGFEAWRGNYPVEGES